MKYVYTVEFDADDDEEARDLIWNPAYGVTNSFGTIHDEKLVREDGGEVK